MRHVWAKNLKTKNNECVRCGTRPGWDGSKMPCSGFMPGLRELQEVYGTFGVKNGRDRKEGQGPRRP